MLDRIIKETILFIRKTFKKDKGFIPLHEPRFLGNEKKYLEECIDSTFVSSVGAFVDRFEKMVCEYTGAAKSVVCVNGTNALHLALLLSGVKPGDEVIIQPLTFIATANAISYCGAFPIFVDVDIDTLGLSPKALKKWLVENVEMRRVGNFKGKEFGKMEPYNKHSGNRIAACVPMHTFGHPCYIDEIIQICNSYNIKIIEDAAESMGSFYKNQHLGTFGNIGVLSFNGNKTITTGGGGMLLFKDVELGEYAKHLTTQAKVPHRWEFRHDDIGYNYRLPNINAALGCAQMEQLPGFIKAKRELAYKYNAYFSKFSSNVTFFKEPENATSNYWLNAVLLKNKEERDQFLRQTNDAGIMTRPVWELLNRLPMYEKAQCGDIVNATWIADRLVNIPSSVIL